MPNSDNDLSFLDRAALAALSGELASQTSDSYWREGNAQQLAIRCYNFAVALDLERRRRNNAD